MRHDSRLPRVLHLLLHLEEMGRPATSAELAAMLQTDGAVVRRTLAGLRERGWLVSTRGHGGGWSLASPLREITLLDLYEALGAPPLFAVGHTGADARCLMERAANRAVELALVDAESAFRSRLAGVTVADLAADFRERLARSIPCEGA
ncbi:MAG: Rrf2 family transcriptional regulator [Myxococcales bacterium]|nr:Rrf2 family transcriptional regulator [Myxococcales bacterium]